MTKAVFTGDVFVHRRRSVERGACNILDVGRQVSIVVAARTISLFKGNSRWHSVRDIEAGVKGSGG